MKNIFKIFLFTFFILSCFRCTIDDRPVMDAAITDLKIIITEGAQPNTFTFTASPKNVIGYWDLGNGVTASGCSSTTGQYPFPGNYTVKLTAYGSGGRTNDISIVLPISQSNYGLLTDSVYTWLTGGINNADGKSWVVDSLLKGHLVKNPQKSSPDWQALAAGYANRANNKYGGGMYDDIITFKLTDKDGPAFIYNNNGDCCAAANAIASGNPGYPGGIYTLLVADAAWSTTSYSVISSFISGGSSDYRVKCTPPQGMTWSVVKDGAGNYNLVLPKTKNGNGGFLFYFTDWSTSYQIKSITANKMVVWKTCTDGAIRQIVMIRKGWIDPDA
jgi:PKD repeat protein